MWKSAAIATLLLGLAACADGASAVDEGAVREGAQAPSENASDNSVAALEMAVSETCEAASSTQCVSIRGEHVLIYPADFERVGVDSAASAGPGMIDVTLDSDGADVMQKLSTEAFDAGEDARLVTQLDSEFLSAVRVQGTFRGQSLQMAVPADVDANGVVARLNGDDG